MACNEVKLLGSWQSPFAFRAQIALNIKSVAYEFQQEDVLLAKSDILLKSNPVHKKIPVLFHNGRPICESLVIVEYVDEVWASRPAILPPDPHDRAMARFWTSYIDDKWFKHLKAIIVSQGEDARRRSHDERKKGLLLLEAECSRADNFFGGDRIGYVDVALGCFLPLISVIEKECDISLIVEFKTPTLFKWAQRFSADAAAKDIWPDTDELCQFYTFLVSLIRGSQGLVIQEFGGGDKMGYLDIAFGCFLPWITVIDKLCNITLIDESKTPNLFKWAQRFCADAAVKDLLPDIDQLYDFSKLLISVMKGSAHNVVG